MTKKALVSAADILKEHGAEIRAIAPKFLSPKRLVALAIEARNRNPLLAKCSPSSVVQFSVRCAEAGTDRIGPGGMWAVPYWNEKRQEYDMAAIPDWRLMVEQARQAGVIKHAYAEAVYENDVFDYEKGLNPKLYHKPSHRDRGALVAAYCVVVLPDDSKDFTLMWWEDDIVPIRNRSNAWKAWEKSKRPCPWVTDAAEMAKKTVVKRALKIFEGASPKLSTLLQIDNEQEYGQTEEDVAFLEPQELPAAEQQPQPQPQQAEPQDAQPAAEAEPAAQPERQPDDQPDIDALVEKAWREAEPEPAPAPTEQPERSRRDEPPPIVERIFSDHVCPYCRKTMTVGEVEYCKKKGIAVVCFRCRQKQKGGRRGRV